ncbi:YfjL-like protein [Paenibacillus radicis (ex Gao et al. 2016)]|uniref:YfjL-like N-terminal domain-containing protein n=1 Tax=Paenibacillus radicis (ex Gao et al. 2016) TaxID=1737354 RepID=A0A917GQF5_9BACL|nr:hypothetical protein [Paenibacillus radicis (ex Gao et al. 2016)]GGG53778.1 hypothetical protein GCM10010918_03200 [Paenibacillus radicis (ex Gao et al. 2016)]
MKIFLSIITVVALVVIYFVYSLFFGNPLSMYHYKKTVQQYLESKYEEPFKVEKVEYSFKLSTLKQSYYAATVKDSKGVLPEFRVVRQNDSNQLRDTLILEIWDKQLTNETSVILKKNYQSEHYTIKNYIPSPQLSNEKIAVTDTPTYENYSKSELLDKRVNITITIQKSYEDEDWNAITTIVKDMVDTPIYFNQLSIEFIDSNYRLDATIKLDWDQAIDIEHQRCSLVEKK